MHLLLDSSYFPSSWGGVIYRENGERVAGVRYAESAGKGMLTLSDGENAFEVHAATESFSGPSTNKGGRMLCNGRHVYSFTSSTPALLEVRTADLRGARTVFRTQLDSAGRTGRDFPGSVPGSMPAGATCWWGASAASARSLQ